MLVVIFLLVILIFFLHAPSTVVFERDAEGRITAIHYVPRL